MQSVMDLLTTRQIFPAIDNKGSVKKKRFKYSSTSQRFTIPFWGRAYKYIIIIWLTPTAGHRSPQNGTIYNLEQSPFTNFLLPLQCHGLSSGGCPTLHFDFQSLPDNLFSQGGCLYKYICHGQRFKLCCCYLLIQTNK